MQAAICPCLQVQRALRTEVACAPRKSPEVSLDELLAQQPDSAKVRRLRTRQAELAQLPDKLARYLELPDGVDGLPTAVFKHQVCITHVHHACRCPCFGLLCTALLLPSAALLSRSGLLRRHWLVLQLAGLSALSKTALLLIPLALPSMPDLAAELCCAQVKWHSRVALPVPGHRGAVDDGVAVLVAYHEQELAAGAARPKGKTLDRVRKRRRASVATAAAALPFGAHGRPRFSDVVIKCACCSCAGLQCVVISDHADYTWGLAKSQTTWSPGKPPLKAGAAAWDCSPRLRTAQPWSQNVRPDSLHLQRGSRGMRETTGPELGQKTAAKLKVLADPQVKCNSRATGMWPALLGLAQSAVSSSTSSSQLDHSYLQAHHESCTGCLNIAWTAPPPAPPFVHATTSTSLTGWLCPCSSSSSRRCWQPPASRCLNIFGACRTARAPSRHLPASAMPALIAAST